MPRQMPVTCEHGREFLHFPLCSECPPDETSTLALLRWLANEHPAEAVAQLIADGVLVDDGTWTDPDDWSIGYEDQVRPEGAVTLYHLNLPTEEGGDGR